MSETHVTEAVNLKQLNEYIGGVKIEIIVVGVSENVQVTEAPS